MLTPRRDDDDDDRRRGRRRSRVFRPLDFSRVPPEEEEEWEEEEEEESELGEGIYVRPDTPPRRPRDVRRERERIITREREREREEALGGRRKTKLFSEDFPYGMNHWTLVLHEYLKPIYWVTRAEDYISPFLDIIQGDSKKRPIPTDMRLASTILLNELTRLRYTALLLKRIAKGNPTHVMGTYVNRWIPASKILMRRMGIEKGDLSRKDGEFIWIPYKEKREVVKTTRPRGRVQRPFIERFHYPQRKSDYWNGLLALFQDLEFASGLIHDYLFSDEYLYIEYVLGQEEITPEQQEEITEVEQELINNTYFSDVEKISKKFVDSIRGISIRKTKRREKSVSSIKGKEKETFPKEEEEEEEKSVAIKKIHDFYKEKIKYGPSLVNITIKKSEDYLFRGISPVDSISTTIAPLNIDGLVNSLLDQYLAREKFKALKRFAKEKLNLK
jgi:hypothetical protein